MTKLKLCLVVGLFMVVYAHVAHSDSWTCTEESSVKFNGAIRSCGIGEAPTENKARLEAFDNAKAEFDRVCRPSIDCNMHSVIVEPARTTCSETKEGWKCYRLIVFKIQPLHDNNVASTGGGLQPWPHTGLDDFWEKWHKQNDYHAP